MSTRNIITNILDENLFGAKEAIVENLYEKVAAALDEKKKTKYAKATDKDDDGEGLDPVDAEDDDVDNDGDSDESDEYLKNRRKTVKKAVKKDDDEVKEDIKKKIEEKFLQIREAQQLDEIPFLAPLAGMAAKAVGGGLLRKLGGGMLKKMGGGLMKKLGGGLKGLMGKGRQLVGGAVKSAMAGGGGGVTHTHEDAESGPDMIYGMEKDKYMKLTDEQKDKIKAKYHREKREMENTRK
tara:strand:+ start:13746 stop:14459 length:714 start_codon:yes stop_codon:yes gene_type:complete